MEPKNIWSGWDLEVGTGHQRDRDDSPDVSQSSQSSSWFCYFKSINGLKVCGHECTKKTPPPHPEILIRGPKKK